MKSPPFIGRNSTIKGGFFNETYSEFLAKVVREYLSGKAS